MSPQTILAAVATLAIVAAAAPGCGRPVPEGRASPLDPDEELAVGRMGRLQVQERFGGALDVPAIQAYVRTIGERLARPAGQTRWPYRFTVLASGQARLFSLPGGQVFLTRGLLEKLDSEAELAGLLARQLVLIDRHYDEVQADLSPVALLEAADTAKTLLSNKRPDRAAAENLAKVVAVWSDVRYTPAMQAEADRRGLDYMVAAGYHPAEMVRLVALVARLENPPGDAGRAEAVRQAADRKYPDDGGRIGRQDFQQEVLDRLKDARAADQPRSDS